MSNKSILVVASSPPPYGGQALMVQSLIEANFKTLRLYHVRMSFSGSMSSVGKFEIKKIGHMISVVFRAAAKRFRYGIDTLYYVPGGSSAVPVIRDIFILAFLRPIFRKVIFHFHAAGVSKVVEGLPWVMRHPAKWMYNSTDLSIFLSERNPDHLYFNSRKSVIAPNGLPDAAQKYLPFERKQRDFTSIFFAGVLQRSKGVMILLQAVRALVQEGHSLQVVLIGEFASMSFKDEVFNFCKIHSLEKTVLFPGVKTDNNKWPYFADADIFCFPSFFESESFGNVVVEAMMFELPVVATHWRGIPDIVQEGETGSLVPVQDSHALMHALEKLITNPGLRHWMGANGRRKYLSNYQLDTFIRTVEKVFDEVVNS